MTKKIIIVEDNRDIRENLAEMLEIAGHEVHQARDGGEALELAREETPDLIVADLQMPVMDGFELLAELGRDKRVAHVPVLIITGTVTSEALMRCLELGAVGTLTKPFSAQEFITAVGDVL
jgi:CheY-like chemotaxis protein